MDILRLKRIGRIDYSKCYMRKPYYDTVCEGWINDEKLEERLYFDGEFWCLAPSSKDYLQNLGILDYMIEVDGHTNQGDYWRKIRLEGMALPLIERRSGNRNNKNTELDALIEMIDSI